MTISPSRLNLFNGGNNSPQSDVLTATFTNPLSSTTVTAVETGGVSHLTISVSVNRVNVASQTGSGNRGNFTVRITPPTGCGTFQDISVSVAK